MVIKYPAHALMSYCRRITFALSTILCLVFVSEVAHGVISTIHSDASMALIVVCDSEVQDSTDEEESNKKEIDRIIDYPEIRQTRGEQTLKAHYFQFLQLHEAYLILRTPSPQKFI